MIDTADRPALEPEAAASETLRNFPILCGLLGFFAGAIVLLGWAFRIDALTQILPGFNAMNPATAVALMCGGLALSVPHSRIGLARGAALAVIVIGGLKLGQLIGGFSFRIDQVLFSATLDNVLNAPPSQMAPNAAVALFLLGCSILSNTVESKRAQLAAQIAAGGAAAISLFSLIGYVLGLGRLFAVLTFVPMALHTALFIFILTIGSLTTRPMILTEILWDRGPAGTMARIVLPLSVLVPMAVGSVRLAGQKAGFYGTEVGVALQVVGNVVVLFALLLASVIALHRSDFARRKREVAVAQSEEQYRLAEKVAGAGHWRLEAAERSVSWSDEIFNIAGIAKEQGVPNQAEILKLYHFEDRDEARMKLIHALKTGDGWSIRTRLVRPDGEVRSVISHGVCEQRAGGRVTAVFGVLADVTELENATREQALAQERLQSVQSELIHLSRVSAMGSMASTLAHELNQPLTAIINYATGSERMVEHGAKSSELTEPLAEIRKSAARAGEVIRRLQDMTRNGVITKNRFSSDDVIIEAVKLAKIGGSTGVNLQYKLHDGQIIMGDTIQIQQVLLNLIRNAYDSLATCGERNVLVVSERFDSEVLISVEDNGPGISPDILPKLFEAFFSTKDDGMGVGLSISRTIIEAHGGNIWAENRPEGGARFSFTLPHAEPSSC